MSLTKGEKCSRRNFHARTDVDDNNRDKFFAAAAAVARHSRDEQQ
jgi:hypothetical protein